MNTPAAPPPTADTQAPSVPGGLTVSGQTQSGLTLGWNASSDNVGVMGYGTYRNGSGAGSTAASTRTYNFTGLTCGTTYTLGVDAYDSAGNRSARAQMSASTAACAGDSQAPSVPSGLMVGGQTQTSISFSWGASFDNVGVAGYGVYNGAAVVGSTAIPSYTVSSLACGTTYTLGVDAYDGAGNRSAKTSLTACDQQLRRRHHASVAAHEPADRPGDGHDDHDDVGRGK